MARPLRLEHPGALWHVTSRGNNRADIFFDDDDRNFFLDLVGEAVVRFHWLLHEYTLMTNHYHLVIETPETTLSRGMKWVNQRYAQRINRKYKRSGHLFQGRFGSQLVEKESHMLEVLRYTVLNPVRAGMVERPEDYRWSSYRAKIGHAPVPEWLTTTTLGEFGKDEVSQREAYRKFVEAGAGLTRSPFDDMVAQLFVGTRTWIERMQALIDTKPRSTEHPAAQRYAGRPDVTQVIEVVADVLETTADEIRQKRGGEERQLVAWLCIYETNERYAKVAAALRLRSTSRVATLAAECVRSVRESLTQRLALDRSLDKLRGSMTMATAILRERYPSVQPHS